MDNPSALAFRRVNVAGAAGTTARYSGRERDSQLRSIHTRVHKSIPVAGSGDVDRYWRFLHVLMKSVQVVLTRAHDELRSALPVRFRHKTLADTLENIE